MSRAPATAALTLLVLASVGCGGGGDGGMTGAPPGAVTVIDVQTKIFTPRCALSGCHAGTGAPFGLDLSSMSSSHANTVDIASAESSGFLRVEPGNAPDSYLYMKLTGDPRILGDPMPLTGGPLSSGDLALIEAWIRGGAK